jgi:hypothetical protein
MIQQSIVGRVVFKAVRIVSNEINPLVLPRIPSILFICTLCLRGSKVPPADNAGKKLIKPTILLKQ